jgi:molybdopterin-containing oxidoreductase family membrane subunit
MLRASKILTPVLLVATFLGGIGLWHRLVFGKAHLAFGSYIPWGLWVGLYIYLVGVSGGALLVAFLHYGLGITSLRRPSRYAVPIALTSLLAGLTLVLLDLGHMDRFWYLFTRTSPTSLLAWMVWVYTLYSLVLLAMLVAMARESQGALKWLSIAGFVLVVTFGGGEGALFGVLASKPYWNSGLQPIRFLFSALLSGVGLVAFACVLFRRWPDDAENEAASRFFRWALLGLLALNIVIEFAEFSVTHYTGFPAVIEAHRLMVFGPYWWVFWILQLGMGLVLPTLLLASPLGGRAPWLALSGLCIAIGYAGTKQNLVLPGLAVPDFRMLPEAFVHPRLTVTYFPSATEWYLAIGVIGAAALAFVLAIEILPFLKDHRAWGVVKTDTPRAAA